MGGPIQPAEFQVTYTEHRRQMATINEHDWKLARPVGRPLRARLAKTLLALARRIAPPTPEMERAMDALTG